MCVGHKTRKLTFRHFFIVILRLYQLIFRIGYFIFKFDVLISCLMNPYCKLIDRKNRISKEIPTFLTRPVVVINMNFSLSFRQVDNIICLFLYIAFCILYVVVYFIDVSVLPNKNSICQTSFVDENYFHWNVNFWNF